LILVWVGFFCAVPHRRDRPRARIRSEHSTSPGVARGPTPWRHPSPGAGYDARFATIVAMKPVTISDITVTSTGELRRSGHRELER
jgi:hypothetical protein